MSFEDLTAAVDRKRVRLLTLVNSSLFILGFSAVFIALGASSSYAGKILFQYQEWISVRFLMREKRFHPKGRPPGTVGAFFIGTAFAAGWTPCIGPILGSILLVASSSGSAVYGVKLLSVYSAGLAIPFLLSSLAFNTFLSYSKTLLRYMRPIKVASGVLMIVFGVVLLTDQLGTITGWFPGLDVTL
jgi:cytochrome c-type biogenesis protein